MAAPAKVLIVTASSDIGGSERQVLHLLRGLDRARFEPSLLSLFGGGELTRRATAAGIPATALKASGTIGRALAGRRHVQRARPDIAYLFGLRTDLILRGAAAGAGAKVISAIRNTDPWRRKWHVALDRATAKHVSLYISNSQAGKEAGIWRERISAERIFVVPNGIELPDTSRRAELRAEFRAKHGIAPDAPLVGLVANYRPQKGHAVALEAFAKLRKSVPGVRMVFAGDDFSHGAIPGEAARLGMGDAVLVLPHQKDLGPIYAALDVFILPSDHEGTPNTLMEAMAWGVPSVATRAGGIPEVMRAEDGGVLIEPRDAAGLEGAITRLLAMGADERGRIGAGLRARIEAGFSIAAMVRRHEELFQELLRVASSQDPRKPRGGRRLGPTRTAGNAE